MTEKLGDLEVSKALRMINKDDFLVPFDFNSLYPSAEADGKSTWPAIETVYLFKKHVNDAVCEILIGGRWDELSLSAFFSIKYHKPENLIFQHLLVREKLLTLKKTIG